MVAAAGTEERLSPTVARGLVAATVVIILLHAFLARRVCLLPVVGSEKSGQVLRVHAREILASLGMPERPADWAGSLEPDVAFFRWAVDHDPAPDRWRRGIARDGLSYVYRESPLPMLPTDLTGGPRPSPLVTDVDPAPVLAGMKEVRLDSEGRLKELHVVPPEMEKASGPGGPVPPDDWSGLFRAAGLDPRVFHPVQPRWSPRGYADSRAAWEGPHPERPGLTMRVEAAAYRGRPVSFLWIGPWSSSLRDVPDQRTAGRRAADLVWIGIVLTLLFAGAWMARRNLRAGRGDRRGAARLAAAVMIVQLAMWVLGAHHLSSEEEFGILVTGLASAAVIGGVAWLVYIALEPMMRRYWPGMLISWTRLIAGNWKDSLVGRDLLVGASSGALIAILMGPIRRYIPPWLGELPPAPRTMTDDPSRVRDGVAWLIQAPAISIWWVLALVMFLVFVRRIVRVQWIAGIVVALFFAANYLGVPPLHVTLPVAAATTGFLVFIAIRFGLLAALVAHTCTRWLESFVMTPDPSTWYFYQGAIAIGLVLALAFWGLRTNQAGREGARS
jgi:serine/threonine-protein kinase